MYFLFACLSMPEFQVGLYLPAFRYKTGTKSSVTGRGRPVLQRTREPPNTAEPQLQTPACQTETLCSTFHHSIKFTAEVSNASSGVPCQVPLSKKHGSYFIWLYVKKAIDHLSSSPKNRRRHRWVGKSRNSAIRSSRDFPLKIAGS